MRNKLIGLFPYHKHTHTQWYDILDRVCTRNIRTTVETETNRRSETWLLPTPAHSLPVAGKRVLQRQICMDGDTDVQRDAFIPTISERRSGQRKAAGPRVTVFHHLMSDMITGDATGWGGGVKVTNNVVTIAVTTNIKC